MCAFVFCALKVDTVILKFSALIKRRPWAEWPAWGYKASKGFLINTLLISKPRRHVENSTRAAQHIKSSRKQILNYLNFEQGKPIWKDLRIEFDIVNKISICQTKPPLIRAQLRLLFLIQLWKSNYAPRGAATTTIAAFDK